MPLRQPIFPLACILVCATLPTRAATPQTCPDGDSDCFERNQVAACQEPSTSTTETCRAWIHLLEQQASTGSSHAELRLADANRAIADLVTDPASRSRHEGRARAIYLERIGRDGNDAESLIALATLIDDENEKIELLKRGVALSPQNAHATQWLASALHERNASGDALAAARHMEQAYDAMKPERWAYHASSTFWYFQQADADDEASRFRARVIDDWGARTLASVTDDTALDDMEPTLEIVCDSYATGVLGPQMCGESVATVMRYLSSADVTPRTQALADAAAGAMESFGRDEWALGCMPPESRATFRSELETLLTLGFESAPVLSAYARAAACGGRLRALQRAVELAPRDGELAWRLGGAYASDGRWDEALAAYRRAMTLPTVVPKSAIDEQIRTTEEKISAY